MTIGHRGTGNSSSDNPYPENTVPSVLAAVDEGARMIEIDIQLSADGIPVLMHDPRVDATTDGVGCVSALTLAELQQFDAGVGTRMEGAGIRIPTLDQVMLATPIDLNLELKAAGDGCPAVSDSDYASAILTEIEQDPAARRILVSSFDFPLLEEIRAQDRQQDPQVVLGQLTISPASIAAAAAAGFDALVLETTAVDHAAVAATRDAGLEIIAWTEDEPARLAELVALDLDGIITNEPPVLEQIRAQACPVADDSGGEPTGSTGPVGGTATTTTITDGTSSAAEDDEGDANGCACRSDPAPSGPRWLISLLPWLGLCRRRST
ncbi:MAG: glycerophosphodiester phosphodiesterase family protein [Myxococcota bacterium]